MVVVRPETSADAEGIRTVLETSLPTPGEARLVEAHRVAGSLIVSLVAEADGAVVGHVAFGSVSAGSSTGAGLAPVAVLPVCRRQGVAARLVSDGLAACGLAGCGFVVVLGEPSYYSRFGFRPSAEWGLFDEFGGGPAFQALELRPGSIPIGAGLVRYAPEFASLTGESADRG
jgi:putative acetyltransferase